jgi:hypothetical protein
VTLTSDAPIVIHESELKPSADNVVGDQKNKEEEWLPKGVDE